MYTYLFAEGQLPALAEGTRRQGRNRVGVFLRMRKSNQSIDPILILDRLFPLSRRLIGCTSPINIIFMTIKTFLNHTCLPPVGEHLLDDELDVLAHLCLHDVPHVSGRMLLPAGLVVDVAVLLLEHVRPGEAALHKVGVGALTLPQGLPS